ncbi:hypothetical protein GJ496_004526 [Pomphorhynchus laevis]|nr:hypothetical protein GJ496_004526 [Pomphorhynchus laevis]
MTKADCYNDNIPSVEQTDTISEQDDTKASDESSDRNELSDREKVELSVESHDSPDDLNETKIPTVST